MRFLWVGRLIARMALKTAGNRGNYSERDVINGPIFVRADKNEGIKKEITNRSGSDIDICKRNMMAGEITTNLPGGLNGNGQLDR